MPSDDNNTPTPDPRDQRLVQLWVREGTRTEVNTLKGALNLTQNGVIRMLLDEHERAQDKLTETREGGEE